MLLRRLSDMVEVRRGMRDTFPLMELERSWRRLQWAQHVICPESVPWVFWVTALDLVLVSFLHLSCLFLLVFMWDKKCLVSKAWDSAGLSVLFPVDRLSVGVWTQLNVCQKADGMSSTPLLSFTFGHSSYHRWVNVLPWEGGSQKWDEWRLAAKPANLS